MEIEMGLGLDWRGGHLECTAGRADCREICLTWAARKKNELSLALTLGRLLSLSLSFVQFATESAASSSPSPK